MNVDMRFVGLSLLKLVCDYDRAKCGKVLDGKKSFCKALLAKVARWEAGTFRQTFMHRINEVERPGLAAFPCGE